MLLPMRVATTLESSNSPKRIATSIFSATRSRKRFVMNRSIRIRGCAFMNLERYIGKYGTKRVRKAVLIGTLGPYLVKTADNPEGVDRSVFDGIKAAIKADRPAFLMDFLRNFYNYDVTGGTLGSERVLEENWNGGGGASAIGTLTCVDSWIEDFRQDIPRNTVPTLIL